MAATRNALLVFVLACLVGAAGAGAGLWPFGPQLVLVAAVCAALSLVIRRTGE